MKSLLETSFQSHIESHSHWHSDSSTPVALVCVCVWVTAAIILPKYPPVSHPSFYLYRRSVLQESWRRLRHHSRCSGGGRHGYGGGIPPNRAPAGVAGKICVSVFQANTRHVMFFQQTANQSRYPESVDYARGLRMKVILLLLFW